MYVRTVGPVIAKATRAAQDVDVLIVVASASRRVCSAKVDLPVAVYVAPTGCSSTCQLKMTCGNIICDVHSIKEQQPMGPDG